jgi:hypothetical protein
MESSIQGSSGTTRLVKLNVMVMGSPQLYEGNSEVIQRGVTGAQVRVGALDVGVLVGLGLGFSVRVGTGGGVALLVGAGVKRRTGDGVGFNVEGFRVERFRVGERVAWRTR